MYCYVGTCSDDSPPVIAWSVDRETHTTPLAWCSYINIAILWGAATTETRALDILKTGLATGRICPTEGGGVSKTTLTATLLIYVTAWVHIMLRWGITTQRLLQCAHSVFIKRETDTLKTLSRFFTKDLTEELMTDIIGKDHQSLKLYLNMTIWEN